MKTRNLKENLLQNDLAGLVDYVISVDRHTPKLAEQEDVIVMAFECENMDVARDLHHFIGHGTYDDILDIDAIDSKNQFWVDSEGSGKVCLIVDEYDQLNPNFSSASSGDIPNNSKIFS